MNATIAGLLLSVVVVRADIVHFIYLEPIFCLPLAWIFEGRDIPGRVFNASKTISKGLYRARISDTVDATAAASGQSSRDRDDTSRRR